MLSLILLVFALFFFLMAAARVQVPRIDFVALGLACLTIAQLIVTRATVVTP